MPYPSKLSLVQFTMQQLGDADDIGVQYFHNRQYYLLVSAYVLKYLDKEYIYRIIALYKLLDTYILYKYNIPS